jgi:Undecaprenyl-phosphate glucose phosphotransferase
MNVPLRREAASSDAEAFDAAAAPPGFRYSPSIVPGVLQFIDLAAIGVAGFAAGAFYPLVFLEYSKIFWFSLFFVGFAFYFVANRIDLYSINSIMRPMSRADDLFVSMVTVFLLLFSVLFSLKEAEEIPVRWHLAFLGAAAVGVFLTRVIARAILARLSRAQAMGRRMVVLGVGEQSARFLRHLARTNPYFIKLDGVFSYHGAQTVEEIAGQRVVGGVDELFARVRAGQIDDIVVAMPWNSDRQLTETVERLKELPVNVYLSTDLAGYELAFKPVVGDISKLPVFEVVQRPISGWSAALKMAEDYVLASLGLLLISPLLLIVAAAIKLDSPGPVLFRQARLGFNNNVFYIYKFRSMRHDPNAEQVVRQATKGDPRVTRVGRIIRATSIDELPQLLNVLEGTMSLVGPRPHALSHNEEYGRQIRGYFARHRVKPGITGWAQVNGLRGETEVLEKMEARIRHDVYYAENWSLFLDMKILVLTVLTVFFQKSAY